MVQLSTLTSNTLANLKAGGIDGYILSVYHFDTTDLLLNYFSPKLFIKKSFKHKNEVIKALTHTMALEEVMIMKRNF